MCIVLFLIGLIPFLTQSTVVPLQFAFGNTILVYGHANFAEVNCERLDGDSMIRENAASAHPFSALLFVILYMILLLLYNNTGNDL